MPNVQDESDARSDRSFVITSSISSASEVAGNTQQFHTWCIGASPTIVVTRTPQPLSLFTQLCDVRLPYDIIQFLESAIANDEFFREERTLATGILQWTRDHPTSLTQVDELDIKVFHRVLVSSFSDVIASSRADKKAEQRLAADEMIKATFCSRKRIGARAQVRMEVDIQLRRSTGANISHAIADTLVVHPLIDGEADRLMNLELAVLQASLSESCDVRFVNSVINSMEYSHTIENRTTIILFAMEAKRDVDQVGVTRICYDLSAAQSQRRALGLKDEVIFGCVFGDGIARIFASYWLGQLTCVEFQGEFNLREPVGLLTFWTFLRRLHDYACDSADDDVRNFDVKKAAQSLRENHWRAEDTGGRDSGRYRGNKRPRLNAVGGMSSAPIAGHLEEVTQRVMTWVANIEEPYDK